MVELSAAGNESRWRTARTVLAFWLLGMCNNYIYVIMLSAAHDVITKIENSTDSNFDVKNSTEPAYQRDCNAISTGAILLADIVPTLFVKSVFPFLPFLVHVRMTFVVLTGILALVLVGLADSFGIAILGVCFAAFNSGLGELTLLAYSTYFPLVAVAAWSSGTGGAGLAGSFAYAAMTEGGLTPEMSLFVSITVPLLLAAAFWIILERPQSAATSLSAVESAKPAPEKLEQPLSVTIGRIWENFKTNLCYIPNLLPYMIPVGLVYYLEYLINSGLYELLTFENTTISPRSQFRWYNALYQIGVFISRSSVSWIQFEKVWVMAVLQAVNVVVLSLDAVYGFIPNVWILFAIILWEGLLGGAAYVNTFYTLSHKIPEDKRLFAMSIASLADTFGIVGAGVSSLPVHDAICQLPYNPLFRWPTLK